MGKRKLHDQQFVQCDWTGLPMLKPGAYMPVWTSKHDGKVQKQGHYLNWETVVAVAHDRYFVKKTLDEDEYNAAMNHIQDECGGRMPLIAPHWKRLSHFGGDLEMTDYLEICTCETGNVKCVHIPYAYDNKPQTAVVQSNIDRYDFGPHLTRPITGYFDMLTSRRATQGSRSAHRCSCPCATPG